VTKRKRMRLVEIEWHDTAGLDGRWATRRQHLRPEACVSVGYITHKTKEYIEVSPHLSKYQKAGHFAIPRSAIRKMREL
jgi:hypothetical protein